MRVALLLVFVNWLVFATFLAQRPSAESELRRKDALMAAGHFEFSTADPWSYIAARPLYNWSEWHGGERTWVKLTEVANLPALFAAGWAVSFADRTTDLGYLQESWVRAWVFLVVATRTLDRTLFTTASPGGRRLTQR